MSEVLEEKHFKDKKGQEYLLTITQDEYYNPEDYLDGYSFHFLYGVPRRDYANINCKESVSKVLEEAFSGKFKNFEALKEKVEEIQEKLKKKGILALPFGSFTHSGTYLLPFGDRGCYGGDYWRFDGCDFSGFVYVKEKDFSCSPEKILKMALDTFNQLNSGEVYNIDLYKCVPEGVGYKKSAMESIEGTLVFAEPEDSLCGNFREGIEEYIEDLKKKGFEEITRGQER